MCWAALNVCCPGTSAEALRSAFERAYEAVRCEGCREAVRMRIDEVVRVHKERRRTNKDAIMTMVVKESGAAHRTR